MIMKKITKRKSPKIKINNHIKAFGEEQNGVITINKKKHRGDKAEEADTLYHELLHAKHPKMTEKETYKKTRKAMKEMSYAEKEKLAAKVRNKKIHYSSGSLKRKFKMGRGNVEPGAFLKKFNETKHQKKSISQSPSLRRIAIDGMV